MLVLDGVTRVHARRRALEDVSLTVGTGQVVALVGDNGAGKSTLLRIAATLDRPTRGRVLVGGVDALAEPAKARRRVAWLGQEPGLYDTLTVRENLAFAARLFDRDGEVARAAASVGIDARLDDRARDLSRGERQRAALARAFVCGDLLLLDEPTTALDADGRALALAAIDAQRGARTVLLATHDEAVARRCDATLRLARGRLEAKR